MPTITLEQALFHRPDRQAPLISARSPGFAEAWIAEAESLIDGFGDRPGVTRCPLAVFARPFGTGHVAVVRVVDSNLGPGFPIGLRFHFLIITKRAYECWVRDPFMLADKAAPIWDATELLPTIEIAEDSFKPRSVADVQNVLRRVKASALREGEDPEAPDFERTVTNSESPALLGAAQIIVDGGRVVFERSAGDLPLASGLWLLLPEATRASRWPASFAFSPELEFDLLVVPQLDELILDSYTTEEQAAEYPEGVYELALQHAAEGGSQKDLDEVFSRRDSNQTLRIAIILFVAACVLVLLSNWLDLGIRPPPPPPPVNPLTIQQQQVAAAVGIVAVGEPWTALGMIVHGKTVWKGPEKADGAK